MEYLPPRAGGHRGFLFVLTLLLGMASVGGRFVVDVDLSSTTPKPESQLDVTCSFNLSHVETEQLVFYDLNSQTICLFLVREGTQQCTVKYNSSVIEKRYTSTEPGKASLKLQLQPCETLTGVRCAVTDTDATERSGTAQFNIQNVPEPSIACVGDCEDSTSNGERKLRFDTNSTQWLSCSVIGSIPEVSFSMSSPYAVNSTNSTIDADRCTYNQTVTAIPAADISSDTRVTCTVTGSGDVTASTTVIVAVGPESPIETTTEESATSTTATTTEPAATTFVELTTTETMQSTSTDSTSSNPNNAGPNDNSLSIGLGVGISLGLLLLAGIGGLVYWFKYRQKSQTRGHRARVSRHDVIIDDVIVVM